MSKAELAAASVLKSRRQCSVSDTRRCSCRRAAANIFSSQIFFSLSSRESCYSLRQQLESRVNQRQHMRRPTCHVINFIRINLLVAALYFKIGGSVASATLAVARVAAQQPAISSILFVNYRCSQAPASIQFCFNRCSYGMVVFRSTHCYRCLFVVQAAT